MRKAVVVLSLLTLFGVVFAAPASAVGIRGITYLTFSGPVALPGVAMPAGEYIFQFPAPGVLQVLSRDRKIAYAMMLTIPKTRAEVSWEHVVTFKETRKDAPPAIETWFRPGESIGYELLYPKPSH